MISGLWPWFPTIWEWFLKFLWSYHRKKYCGRNRIDCGCTCGTDFTLMSLYSTEITCYRSWFLEYKLMRVKSIPHGCPWWILYILRNQYHSCWWPGYTRSRCISSIDLVIPDYSSLSITTVQHPGPHVTTVYELMIQISKLSWTALTCKIIIQTGQNFAHATTAELSWHAQNSDLEWILTWKIKENFHKISITSS